MRTDGKTTIHSLSAYNFWATHRILQATERITPAQLLADAPVSVGNLRGTLVHILGAEWLWRKRCQEGIAPSSLLSEDQFSTLDLLRTVWRQEEEAW